MRLLHLPIAALLAVYVLSVSLAICRPQEGKRTGANYFVITDSTTSIASSSPSSSSTARSTAKTITSAENLTALLTAQTRVAKASSSMSIPLATFCKAFTKQCYRTALSGQTGDVTVAHSCQRNGPTSFTYSCSSNGETVTAKVLRALGKDFFQTSTTTTAESFQVVTEIVDDVSTAYDVTTQSTTVTGITITTTFWTERLNVDMVTVPVTTVNLTLLVPYTTTSTASATTTEQATVTNTLTRTQSEIFIGPDQIPVYQVAVRQAEELQRRAPSTFCLAFRISCQSECRRVSSRVASEICEGTQKTSVYTLTCICKNGKIQTQHALEAIAEDKRIASVTLMGTSTSYLTSSRTTTIPTTVAATRLVTLTASVDRTSTASTTSTATVGEATRYTTLSSAAATALTTTIAATRTSATTSTVEVSTTTKVVLATTGFVHAFNLTNGRQVGVLGSYYIYARIFPVDYDDPNLELMAVRDGPTGLYQLAEVGSPDLVLQLNQVAPDGIFESGGLDAAPLNFQAAQNCASNGFGPGPTSSRSTCETFVFSPLALDSSPGATADTVSLRPFWINPAGFVPANFSGLWGYTTAQNQVWHVADKATWDRLYPDFMTFITLRFPFPR